MRLHWQMKERILAIPGILLAALVVAILVWHLFQYAFRQNPPTREEVTIRNCMANVQQLAIACNIYRQQYGFYPDRWGRLLDTGRVPLYDAKHFFSCRLSPGVLEIVKGQRGFEVTGTPFRFVLDEETTASSESKTPLIQGTLSTGLEVIAYRDTEVRCYQNGQLRAIKERVNTGFGLRH